MAVSIIEQSLIQGTSVPVGQELIFVVLTRQQ
jgi:hypothetical protein